MPRLVGFVMICVPGWWSQACVSNFKIFNLGECDMERFSWWRMEQVQHPLSRALCGAFCSILHHVKRSMSHPPYRAICLKKVEYRNRIDRRVLPWGKAEQWGSLCATVFCELCTSTEARALSYSSVYFLGSWLCFLVFDAKVFIIQVKGSVSEK